MFQNDSHSRSRDTDRPDLEERLIAYYGPELPPQPLAESAWLHLRDQLKPQHPVPAHDRSRRAARLKYQRLRRKRVVPADLQQAFTRISNRIDYPRPYPELNCTFHNSLAQPRVSVLPLGRGEVRLALSGQNWCQLQPVELEVLLAVGLARYLGSAHPRSAVTRALFACCCLLTMASLPLAATDRRFLWLSCAAFACCVAGLYLLSQQRRRIAFQGDLQAVQWLGREQVCQGLHLLATRGRERGQLSWGEPSMSERITRVCGSSVLSRDKCLTLTN